MIEYYINSTKYAIQERKTKKHGTVYDGVFRVITIDGDEKQKKLSGYTSKKLLKEAYLSFIQEKCELVKGNPVKKKNVEKDTPTVGALVREYLAALSNQNKDSSIYDKQNIYRLFLLPEYEDQNITVFTKEELYRLQDRLWAEKNPRTNDFYSYKYLEKIRGHISAFLVWCESRYGFKNNLVDVTKPKRRASSSEMQIWTRDEFELFINEVEDPMWHCFFTLLFFTGRRKGEILALTKEDIQGKNIRINKSLTRKTIDGSPYKITTTKADKKQLIPMCEIVSKELEAYKGEAPFFFGGDKPLAENTVTRVFQKYAAAAGLNQIRIHDLRHSYVSMLIHLGANFMVVADLIGDTVEQVTKTYAHMYESDKLAVIAKIK